MSKTFLVMAAFFAFGPTAYGDCRYDMMKTGDLVRMLRQANAEMNQFMWKIDPARVEVARKAIPLADATITRVLGVVRSDSAAKDLEPYELALKEINRNMFLMYELMRYRSTAETSAILREVVEADFQRVADINTGWSEKTGNEVSMFQFYLRTEAERIRHLKLRESLSAANPDFASLIAGNTEISHLQSPYDPTAEVKVARRLISLDHALMNTEAGVADYAAGKMTAADQDVFLTKVKIIRDFTWTAYLLGVGGKLDATYRQLRDVSFMRVAALTTVVLDKSGPLGLSDDAPEFSHAPQVIPPGQLDGLAEYLVDAVRSAKP